jgi:alcohol dehydrogenase (cytochrome c)/quinohemoprotein ethanol dehydrogenase
MTRSTSFASTLGFLTLTACSSGGPTGVQPPAPGLDDLRPVADAAWTAHGRDLAETRFSPMDQIDASNVMGLEPVWSYVMPKGGARVEATPIIADGIMYTTGPMSTVFALDARTGDPIWHWDPAIPDEDQGGPSVCCGDVNRGVAIFGDKIYVGLLDGRLVALRRADGSVAWTVQTTPPGQDFSITGAPRVFRGMVVIGNGGAEYGVRGYVTAYDAETGDQVWRTYTVPGNPADGYENEAMRRAAETWSGEWWAIGGGGTVWDAMAYDGAANLLYIGTGNGAPWNREYRSHGTGDNLYLSSIVALDGDTGEYVWHYQTTPGDDWDYTATQPLMLLDLTIGGRQRQVIVQAPKNGFFYVVDRLTGELISANAFADDVTWATHVDRHTGRPVETPAARYGANRQGAWISPGPTGAHNWRPMAFSAQTGLVYLPTQNNVFWYEMIEGMAYTRGMWNTGTTVRGGGSSVARPPRPELTGPPTALKAWDPVGNTEVWRRAYTGSGNGGTLATGGNLVFWGTGDRMVALDARTGEELWSAVVGPTAGTPITWALDGRQYVSIPGGFGAGTPPTVWTFALPTGS